MKTMERTETDRFIRRGTRREEYTDLSTLLLYDVVVVFNSEADHQILFNLDRKVVVIFLTQAVTLFIVPYLFNIFTLNVKARNCCLYLFTHSLMHVTPYNYDAVYRNSIFIQNTNQYA